MLTHSPPPVACESKGPGKKWGEEWLRRQGGRGGGLGGEVRHATVGELDRRWLGAQSHSQALDFSLAPM